MSQLGTVITLTVLLAACTTDITDQIHEEIEQNGDLPCETDSGEVDAPPCSDSEDSAIKNECTPGQYWACGVHGCDGGFARVDWYCGSRGADPDYWTCEPC